MKKQETLKYTKKLKKAAREVKKYTEDPVMFEMVLDALAMSILCNEAWDMDMCLEEIKVDVLHYVPAENMCEAFGVQVSY